MSGRERPQELADGSRIWAPGIIGPSTADMDYSASISSTPIESQTKRVKRSSRLVTSVTNRVRGAWDRLPAPVRLGGTAVALSLTAVACGGASGENDGPSASAEATIPGSPQTPATPDGKAPEPTLTAVAPVATETAQVPAETGTAEAPPTASGSPVPSPDTTASPEPTAEATPEMTLEQAIAKLDIIINQVQNPDPAIAANYEPTAWEIRLITILDGDGDPDSGRPGLNDVRDALANGNLELAMSRMIQRGPSNRSLIFSSITNPMSTQSGGPEPMIRWTDQEINRYDPDREFIGPSFAFYSVPQASLKPTINFLQLYSFLRTIPQ